ncbi:hypothetical protein EDF60_0016 [Leucobacter luti]|uniref:hypothetical protein n=1 Tax=Leucobacter luti TaxID=340320 RepID=UPI0010468182|nr:hypothetical protein [Leucobacter luti]MCW2289036.1 hypothetical protein [Leucobacter luti]MCW2289164.1 hypothetical protein [Leucobacter luti]TCK46460.1 hypothetical protein EDF60_0016 [Leucobacter luti]
MTQQQIIESPRVPVPFLAPTVTKQSWSFMIGSALFAGGTAISIWDLGSANLTNILCFIGAWFFTAAGLMQVILSGNASVPVDYGAGKMFRAVWLAAAIQSFGTIMFNISTSAALTAKTVRAEERLVWNPDAGGSVAFLISAVFVYVAYYREHGRIWEPRDSGWWGAQINMIGCIAFAVSVVGAFVRTNGSTADTALANWGTFIGAICFFLASMIVLPQLRWNRHTP